MGELSRRLAESSWGRAITAISGFYECAKAEGLIESVPFSCRLQVISGGGRGRQVVNRNLARERQPHSHVSSAGSRSGSGGCVTQSLVAREAAF